jgi:uncharacterized protein (TIGR03083 family)
MEDASWSGEVARECAQRTARLVAVLRQLDRNAFFAPSRLPEWDRLTIVCHLRYGVTALLRMTSDALAGRETSYYPAGRATQRPMTLAPLLGERPDDVVNGLADAADRLDGLWSSLEPDAWATPVTEPADNTDLGTIPLARLALARLTEVDVHGVDLDVGFPDWSDTLIDFAPPVRLGWLSTRRTNHRDFDRSLQGQWLLVAGNFRWIVAVDGDRVSSSPAGPEIDPPRATIIGTRRDLLALLLGRPRLRALEFAGDVHFGAMFEQAFPGP